MTKAECEYLIATAEDKGLESSNTVYLNKKRQFVLRDANTDKRLDIEEVRDYNSKSLFLVTFSNQILRKIAEPNNFYFYSCYFTM